MNAKIPKTEMALFHDILNLVKMRIGKCALLNKEFKNIVLVFTMGDMFGL